MKKNITFLILHFTVLALAQPGSLDTGFNSAYSGADDSVSIISIQSDSKIIIGGRFINYNGFSKKTMARLNVDGSLDTGFDVGIGASDGDIWGNDIQSDGKIVILGGFSTFNDTFRKRIVRLNSNGSLDLNYDPGSIVENFGIFNMAIQPDDKIVISSYPDNSDAPQDKFPISRLNIDGSYDTGFISAIANNYIDEISIQTDGKIIVVGTFNMINGISRNGIARLNTNGSLDVSFNPEAGLIGGVWTIMMQSDGKILVGGDFGINRLNSNGSLDASFNSGGGVDDSVRAIAIQPGGKIVIGGDFATFNDIPRNGIARLNIDGTLDTSFNPGAGTNGGVEALSIQSDGKIVIGGDFTSYNGTVRNRIARINGDTPLRIDEQKGYQSKIVPYPNPTKDFINIQNESSFAIDKVVIRDTTGKQVLQQNQNTTQINVEKLSAGLYIIEAYSDNDKFQSKFVKK